MTAYTTKDHDEAKAAIKTLGEIIDKYLPPSPEKIRAQLAKVNRIHKAKGCSYCEAEKTDFHPSHDASPNCQSGGRNHCSCDVCF